MPGGHGMEDGLELGLVLDPLADDPAHAAHHLLTLQAVRGDLVVEHRPHR